MSSDIHERIQKNPKFQALNRSRSRFAISLSIIMLVIYYGFVLVVGFTPDVLAQPIYEGSNISIGFPICALIIITAWLMTGIYISRANSSFDRMNQEILKEAQE